MVISLWSMYIIDWESHLYFHNLHTISPTCWQKGENTIKERSNPLIFRDFRRIVFLNGNWFDIYSDKNHQPMLTFLMTFGKTVSSQPFCEGERFVYGSSRIKSLSQQRYFFTTKMALIYFFRVWKSLLEMSL